VKVFERVEMFQNWLDLRLVTLLMVALVVAFVLACGESEAESSVTIVAAQPTATAKPAPTATVTAVATEKPVATVSTVATAVPVATAGVETFDKSRFANVDGIVDQTNFDWPRSIETTEA